MDFFSIHMEQKVKLFSNMILCCHNLYYSVYTSDHQTLFQNSPAAFPLGLLLGDSADWENIDLLGDEQHRPVVLSSRLGVSWIMVPVPPQNACHVLGPFFLTAVSQKDIEAGLEARHFSMPLRHQVLSVLQELPVISINRILEYAMMLYYCLYEERITIDAISFMGAASSHPSSREAPKASVWHGTYEMEREMVRIVREGDLNYRAHMNRLAVTGTVGKLSNDEPLRQVKNSVLVAIILFSRAAIDGGLNPEISYALTDFYFQGVEACDNIADLADLMHTMEEDFIQRVHACRTNTAYSAPVRSCAEYLDFHLEDEIDFAALSASLGYDEQYFSKKFKRETGQTPKAYLLRRRFERSKFLLKNTDKSIGEISARLRFCSQSHFTEQFRKRFGLTPMAYRGDARDHDRP